MKVKIRKKGPVSMLYVEGKLTIPREVHLREAMHDLLGAGERLFLLNLVDCPYLDSAGLGETVACWQRVQDVGGRIALVMQGKTQSLFVMTGLNRVFPIYQDEQEALASFIPTGDASRSGSSAGVGGPEPRSRVPRPGERRSSNGSAS